MIRDAFGRARAQLPRLSPVRKAVLGDMEVLAMAFVAELFARLDQ